MKRERYGIDPLSDEDIEKIRDYYGIDPLEEISGGEETSEPLPPEMVEFIFDDYEEKKKS